VRVLGKRQLGRVVGRRILPALSNATVRRLAVLSLRWWQRDAHPYVGLVRSVLDDPVREVRAAAADWIRERDDLLETERDISR
jgi:hypothetical protein